MLIQTALVGRFGDDARHEAGADHERQHDAPAIVAGAQEQGHGDSPRQPRIYHDLGDAVHRECVEEHRAHERRDGHSRGGDAERWLEDDDEQGCDRDRDGLGHPQDKPNTKQRGEMLGFRGQAVRRRQGQPRNRHQDGQHEAPRRGRRGWRGLCPIICGGADDRCGLHA